MQADAEVIHRGVTTLSYARSDIHSMCNGIEQAVREASSHNKNGKFTKCTSRINEIVRKMRQSAEDLSQIGQTLQRLEYVVRAMDE